MELTPRQQSVLGMVVRHYVATAQPVSSKALLELSGIDFSSATIRNEMATLEAAGYLTHPHTSAGRVPTDKGYRYFVERLIGDVELASEERNTIRHQFHQARLEMGAWMQLAAAVLARASHSAALITAPQIEMPRVKHIELISTQPYLVLVILVLNGGTVRQHLLPIAEACDQAMLSAITNKFNAAYVGLDASAIQQKKTELNELETQIAQQLTKLMIVTPAQSSEYVRDGLTQVLQEPEFVSQMDAHALMTALEQPNLLSEALNAPIGTAQVIIGGEGRWRELSTCSVVLTRYGVEGFATGALGVVGPTRMPYRRAIGTIRYVADLMSDLVSEMYGEE